MVQSFYDLRRRRQQLSLLPNFLLLLLTLLLVTPTPSYGFIFHFSSTPSQCTTTSAIWDGGSPPFKLLLLPIGFMPQGEERRIIFEKSVEQGREMAFDFPFPGGSKFVAVMSDSTGFGTGGTSPVLTVSSSNTTSCLPTSPSTPQFYLYLSPTTPSQCSPISISWDTPRNPPVNIYGVIPQGKSFKVTPSNTNREGGDGGGGGGGGGGFDWTCNVPSGTPFFFVAGDGNGSGTGGSTDASPVRGGGSGCIDASSPRSTPDGGVGSVGVLPGGGGGGGTVTGTGIATATPTNGSGQDGGGGGTAGGDGGGGGGGGTTAAGGGGGGGDGNTNGSGGGTVHGPLDPTTIAGVSNSYNSPNIALIIGVVLGLLALALLIALLLLFYKRRKTALARRDNQRARLLAIGDFSDTHLPQSDGDVAAGPTSAIGMGVVGAMAEMRNGRGGRGRAGVGGRSPLDLPHPRPAFAATSWAGGSLESLTSNLRSTPFIWPLGSGSTTNSPVSPSSDRRTPRTPRERERDTHEISGAGGGDVNAVGATTARPLLDRGEGSSSGMLRRLRSVRYTGGGGSGFSFGFPFGGGGGYRSLGDGSGPGGDETTPSSGLQNTTTNTSSGYGTGTGTGTGHVTTPSGDSNAASSEMHKSPLPPSYTAQQQRQGVQGLQHASQNSHGSNGSRLSSQPGIPLQSRIPSPGGEVSPPLQPPELPFASNSPFTSNSPSVPNSGVDTQDPLSRPSVAPLGPRPLLGVQRPSLGREDTGGSVWEVPPTYASLQGRRGGLGRPD